MSNILKVKRALISVSDKKRIVYLSNFLKNIGCEIISTGGTRTILEEADIQTTDITKISGNPEAFGGRMKTISFNVESSILFDREKDKEEAEKLGIEGIDLVVCNLYPFKKVVDEGADLDTLIENVDVGGPTMIRSAAKNFKWVGVVVSPKDYDELIEEIQEHGGLTEDFRYNLMCKAFIHTANYDKIISQAFLDKLM